MASSAGNTNALAATVQTIAMPQQLIPIYTTTTTSAPPPAEQDRHNNNNILRFQNIDTQPAPSPYHVVHFPQPIFATNASHFPQTINNPTFVQDRVNTLFPESSFSTFIPTGEIPQTGLRSSSQVSNIQPAQLQTAVSSNLNAFPDLRPRAAPVLNNSLEIPAKNQLLNRVQTEISHASNALVSLAEQGAPRIDGEHVVPLGDEEPVYVNRKQYHRILKRRAQRQRILEKMKLERRNEPYMHESRHRHAMNRERGKGGRFMKKNGSKEEE